MAITHIDDVYIFAVADDTMTGRFLVNAFIFTTGATGGLSTVRVGSASGPLIFQVTTTANTTNIMTFSAPQWFSYIRAEDLGTNTTLLVVVV